MHSKAALPCFSESGEVRWIARPEADYRGIRFNDGKVDRQGNFWAGTMVEDPAKANGALGSLYRLTPGEELTRPVDGIGIANSIAWSLDSTCMWLADSARGAIWRFALDPLSGSLSERIDFAALSGERSPDGSDVDGEHSLWNAEWGGACLTRYAGGGSQHFSLPVSQPTSIAFGGPDLDHIFVTTAREGLSRHQLMAEPDAGDVLILKASVAGVPSPKFLLENV